MRKLTPRNRSGQGRTRLFRYAARKGRDGLLVEQQILPRLQIAAVIVREDLIAILSA